MPGSVYQPGAQRGKVTWHIEGGSAGLLVVVGAILVLLLAGGDPIGLVGAVVEAVARLFGWSSKVAPATTLLQQALA